MTQNDSNPATLSADEFLELIDDENEKLAWFLREVRAETENGKSPQEIANELYYEIEDGPANIEYEIVLSILFGVLWQKDDQSQAAETAAEN